ncbi:MAG: GTP-binding protein HSR1 [Salinisphaeraceae bacterium]|nr:GTP-binding protein HSR1 [Salinisphaeraceae bacterium]
MANSSGPHDPAEGQGGAVPGTRDDFWRIKESLRALLDDPHVPPGIRENLRADYDTLRAMLDKLEQEQVHIAVFGRVSVGKSSLLNALIGAPRFTVSALHGETARPAMQSWETVASQGVYFIDTPGINEVDGKAREQMAVEVAGRSDLVLFVVDGDMTASELDALERIWMQSRPMLLVLNKADQYTREEQQQLLERLGERARGRVAPEDIVATSAHPGERIYLVADEAGQEIEQRRRPPPDVAALKARLIRILETEGKMLAAVNAGLFAGELSDQVARRVTQAKQEVAARVIRNYCIGKGVAVAVNPVPVTDLAAAAALDITLVVHLGRVYGLPVTRGEAGRLIAQISAQLALLMGAVWGMNLLSSALKTVSVGASVAITAVGQGAAGYYATYVVGQCAEHYFLQGKSWGAKGPKTAVRDILSGIDRRSILQQAREDIRARLRTQPGRSSWFSRRSRSEDK